MDEEICPWCKMKLSKEHQRSCIEKQIIDERRGYKEGWLVKPINYYYKADVSVGKPKYIRHKKKRNIRCINCSNLIIFKTRNYCFIYEKNIRDIRKIKNCKYYKRGRPTKHG